MKAAITVFALLLATTPFASAHGNEDRASPEDQDIDVRFIVGRFDFAELNMQIPEGETIKWRLRATDNNPVKVDLHAHGETDVLYFHQNNSTSADDGVFRARDHHEYSIAIYNPGEGPATVRLMVEGFFAVTDSLGFEIEGEESPLGGGVVIAATGIVVAFAASRRKTQ